ncbi:MAG: hypothetical protein V2J89_05240 [Halieaceae bacterium]|jgi:hypothetical protein|nr:hypothetical protein [Halieaceae bacterium]
MNNQNRPADRTEAQLTDRLVASLDDSLHDYDGETLSRLNRVRQAALEEPMHRPWRRALIPLAAASLAGIAAFIATPLLLQTDDPASPATYTAADDAELVENLDLVLWMMDAEDHAS